MAEEDQARDIAQVRCERRTRPPAQVHREQANDEQDVPPHHRLGARLNRAAGGAQEREHGRERHARGGGKCVPGHRIGIELTDEEERHAPESNGHGGEVGLRRPFVEEHRASHEKVERRRVLEEVTAASSTSGCSSTISVAAYINSVVSLVAATNITSVSA